MAAFRALATLCDDLARTRSRRELARRLADFLGALAPDEVRPAVRLLLGQAGRGEAATGAATIWPVALRLAGVDGEGAEAWAGAVDDGEAIERVLAGRPRSEEPPPLSIIDVEDRIRALGAARGPGARALRERLLADMLERLTPREAKYVAKNLVRDMRTGAAEGVLLDALALLAGGDRAGVGRAHQLEGDLAEVASAVLARPGQPLVPPALVYFRPLRPMLAQSADTVGAALALFGGRAAVEQKLDGARVQLHRRGTDCRLYSRRLQD